MALMQAEDFSGPVNLGNPGEFTILELARKVIQITGSQSPIVHEALPPDDPVQRKPDIALAGEKLGWAPTVDLQKGLEATVADFRRRLKEST